jgi:hypothetical protein
VTVEEACQRVDRGWDGSLLGVPRSHTILDSSGLVLQASFLGSSNIAMDADGDNGLLVTTSSGPGADGGGTQTSGLGSALDVGADEIGVGVLSGGGGIWDGRWRPARHPQHVSWQHLPWKQQWCHPA